MPKRTLNASLTERQRLTANLLALASAYRAATLTELTTIGQRFAGDWRFFTMLRAGGRDFRVGTYDAIAARFAAAWPEATAWPDGVPRPPQPSADSQNGGKDGEAG